MTTSSISETTTTAPRRLPAVWAFVVGAAILLTTFAAYQRAFSSFAHYDDEGYVAISLKEYVKGGALYEDVYSQYGPSWFVCQGWLHRVTDLPITHDVIRFKTITVWVVSSLLVGLVILQMTGCRFTAFGGMLLAFLHLDRLVLEPGHPQELCLLAVLTVLALATGTWGSRRVRLLLIAPIAATVVLAKLNVGLFLVASLLLSHAIASRNSKWRRVATIGVTTCIVLGAVVVTRSTLTEPRGFYLPVMVAMSVLSVAWLGSRWRGERVLTVGDLVGFHAVVIGTGIVFLAVVMSGGTSAAGLLDGVVLQHLGFAGSFYMSPPLFAFTTLLAVAAFGAAVKSSTHRAAIVRAGRLGMLTVIIGVLLRHFTDSGMLLQHGLQDRGHAGLLMSFVGPLAWFVLHNSEGQQWSERQWFGRLSLACIAALQPLIAYPIPGTQMAVGALPLLIIAMVSIRDLVAAEILASNGKTGFASGVRGMLVVCPTLILCTVAYSIHQYRNRLQPLNLAGAERMRLPAAHAEELRGLVLAIRENGNTFVSCYRAYNSLYLFAGVEPPTGLNATMWPWMLTDEQQQRVIDAVEADDQICAVDNVIKVRDEPQTLLGDFLKQRFAVESSIGSWRLLIQKPR